jgi:ribosome biogenesis SPOUT family RNA methylase Rps3
MPNKKPIYIIEHLEPELFEWCLIEYEHISETVGKNQLWFTNIKQKDAKKLEKFGKVFSESVKQMKLDNVCVLDPEAKSTLSPSDKFDYYIFGGILGDYPPKKRTKKELTQFIKNAETRDIGKEQMSTDNAVFTVKQIVEKGKKLGELEFKDNVSLKLGKFEFVDLPYRYNLVDGQPFMSKKIKEYLNKKRGF